MTLAERGRTRTTGRPRLIVDRSRSNDLDGSTILKKALKALIPDAALRLPILGGPFAGGFFIGRPRDSLRKVMGVYEHELNPWLIKVLPRVNVVLDLGGNVGYFSFGCAAAFRRKDIVTAIICFEPDEYYCQILEQGAGRYRSSKLDITIVQKFVGAGGDVADTIQLESVASQLEDGQRALVKIDVEGAELDVLSHGGPWLTSQNYFLIEVHAESLIKPIVNLLAEHGVSLQQIDQRPHWLLGPEQRDKDNRWLVSAL